MPREIAYNWLDRTASGLSPEEAMFVVRLQANEDAAYDELVRTYSASMFHVAYRMLGDNAEASDIVNRMRERGVLLGTDGPFANVLKIRPPMPFTRENGDHLAAVLDEVLGG